MTQLDDSKNTGKLVDPNTPSAISAKLVLALFKAHLDSDEHKFRETALDIAEEFRLNGKHELYEYILAQYKLIRTFEVTD